MRLARIEGITEREHDILDCLFFEISAEKEIAQTLHLSPKTINWHLQNIYQKLHVNNKSDATAKYTKYQMRNVIKVDFANEIESRLNNEDN